MSEWDANVEGHSWNIDSCPLGGDKSCKEAHWTECEAFFEAQAAKESRNVSWLDKFGFWLLKDAMKDSIQSALYIKNYGVCSVGRIEGRVVTFGICGAVIFIGKD